MTGPASRRGFLSGLTALPLIGGGVTLIGQPTAVAAPVTDQLLNSYLAFVGREFRELMVEMDRRQVEKAVLADVREGRFVRPGYVDECEARTRERLSYLEHPALVTKGRLSTEAAPSTRAALVLSTVGCEWDGEGRT